MVVLGSDFVRDGSASKYALYSTCDDLPADFIPEVIRRAERYLQRFENEDEKLVHVDTLVGWTFERLANRLLEEHNRSDSPFATTIFFVAEKGSVEGDYVVAVGIDPQATVGNRAEIEGVGRLIPEAVLIDGTLIQSDVRGIQMIILDADEDGVRRYDLDEPEPQPDPIEADHMATFALGDDGQSHPASSTGAGSDPASSIQAAGDVESAGHQRLLGGQG